MESTINPFTISGSTIMGNGNNTEFFSGALDEVRIYNRALTESEISTLYNYTK
jgi:hypothetical protein